MQVRNSTGVQMESMLIPIGETRLNVLDTGAGEPALVFLHY